MCIRDRCSPVTQLNTMFFVGATWNRLFQEINVIIKEIKIFKSYFYEKYKQVSLA